MMKNKKKTQTVLLSTLLIGGINYTAYVDAQKNGVPTPSEMEFGQACSGPLFQAKLEANNERYKAANSMTPSSSGTYSRRRLMDDIAKGVEEESLGPDGPDARDDCDDDSAFGSERIDEEEQRALSGEGNHVQF